MQTEYMSSTEIFSSTVVDDIFSMDKGYYDEDDYSLLLGVWYSTDDISDADSYFSIIIKDSEHDLYGVYDRIISKIDDLSFRDNTNAVIEFALLGTHIEHRRLVHDANIELGGYIDKFTKLHPTMDKKMIVSAFSSACATRLV
jgi:hypothetical protein